MYNKVIQFYFQDCVCVYVCVHMCMLSHAQLSEIPWIVAC